MWGHEGVPRVAPDFKRHVQRIADRPAHPRVRSSPMVRRRRGVGLVQASASESRARSKPNRNLRSVEPAWSLCRDVARENGRTFYFASRFMPSHQRRAIHAIYAYCRVADDIVDNAPATGIASAEAELAAWQAELDDPHHPIAVTFAIVRDRYGVPVDAARDLVAGVRMDLFHQHYPTWDDLAEYCYKVAGTVGLMAAPLLGCTDESALGYAVNLGIAMQLTNILRDVAEDAELGRLYLPLDDLVAFGCDPESILTARPNGRFQELVAFEIARARDYYASARLGVPALSPSGRFTALASARLYGGILDRIEDQDYDVFAGRAHLSTRRKLRALPNVTGDFFRLSLPLSARLGGRRR